MGDTEVPDWLRSLPLAPEYRPTETEFSDPIAFISRIEREASASGICKIIPPLPKPSRRFVLANLARSLPPSRGGPLLTTRCQELGSRRGRGSVQKQVWQSGESCTLEQFEARARAFARSQNCKEAAPMGVEALFWKAAEEKPIYVDYANDVPGSGFSVPEEELLKGCAYWRPRKRKLDGGTTPPVGSRKDAATEGSAGWRLSNTPWNLQVISRSHGSLTRFMPDEIPGVTSPMVYIGMLFSWFAWHVEDHELHSLNFLHMGAAKTWYAVPASHAAMLEEVVRVKGYGDDVDRLTAFAMLGEKRTLISPEVLISCGIPCCRLVQNPGEFVVTFPRAYHVGFSHGFTCGEAANFATSKWLNVAEEAAVRRASMNYLPMLSHQQLLYLLAVSFISRIKDAHNRAFLAGVRSSRLKDRQKEERELLIKKAFLQDIMNELRLVNMLLGRKLTSRVVLWNTDMLSLLNDGHSSPGQELTVALSKGDLDCVTDHKINLQLVGYEDSTDCKLNGALTDSAPQEFAVQKTSVDILGAVECGYSDDIKNNCLGSNLQKGLADQHDDEGDLPYGLDTDSGALACLACGILGYPFMSIIQPSTETTETLWPVNAKTTNRKHECLKLKGCAQGCWSDLNSGCMSGDRETLSKHLIETKKCVKEYCIEAYAGSCISFKWNLCDPKMRPRIFCLKHGIQVEKKLQAYGGACLLIICHSDYLKVKSHAMAVKDVDVQFDFEDILMENASKEELDLINISIDDGQWEDCEDEWTVKMGLNLKQFIKSRKGISSNQVKSCFSLDGIFPDSLMLSESALRWHVRKSRTPNKYKASLRSKFQSGPTVEIEDAVEVLPEVFLEKNEVEKSRDHKKSCPTLSILQDSAVIESPKSLKENELIFSNRLDVENNDKTIFNTVAFDQGRISQIHKISDSPAPVYVNSVSLSGPSLLEGKRSSNAVLGHHELDDHLKNRPEFEDSRQLGINIKETGTGVMDSVSDFMIREPNQLTFESSIELSDISQNGTSSQKQPDNHPILISTTLNLELQHDKGHIGNACAESNSASNTLPTSFPTSFVNSKISVSIRSKGTPEKVDSEHLPVTTVPVKCYRRRKKNRPGDLISSIECSSVSITTSNIKAFHTLNKDGEHSKDDEHANVKQALGSSKRRVKGKRELHQLSCSQHSFASFARSPCEGLRARSSTSSSELKRNSKVNLLGRKADNHAAFRKKNSHGVLYQCSLEGCCMKFATKAELALHESNCCTFEV